MRKLIKLCFLASLLALIVMPAVLIHAQEIETGEAEDVPEEVIIDETVTAEDLGIKEPTLLPDSKFYFLKSWRRGLRSIFTRDPIKKAELKLRYASEKLLEAKKLADKNKRPEILTKAAESFQQEMEKVMEQVNKIKETASTNPEVGKFLDKFVKQQVLHQKILDKIEEKVPEGALEKIRAVKERHLEKFGLVMEKLEDKTQIKSRIENNLKELKGSVFKQVKEMEILKRFEEKAPEAIKEKIMEAREARLDDFKEKFIEMKPAVQEKFQNYVGKMKGLAENKMEILEDIKGKIQFRPDIKEKLEIIQYKIADKAIEESGSQGLQCPLSELGPLGCRGRIIIERASNGCPVPRCIEVTEAPTAVPSTAPIQGSTGEKARERVQQICTTLWDPVCGVNGKTYGNACRVKAAGIEIKYKGACKSIIPDIDTNSEVIKSDEVTNTDEKITIGYCDTIADCEYVEMTGACNNPVRVAKYMKRLAEQGISPQRAPKRESVKCACVNNKCVEITAEEATPL